MSSTDPVALARLLRARLEAGPLPVEVSGGSMGRTIVGGSSVRLVAAERPRWGEVWAYCAPTAEITVHRYVGRTRDPQRRLHRFWGDGQPSPDPPQPDEVLVGRVEAVVGPDGRRRRLGPADRWGRSAVLWQQRLPRRLAWRLRALLRRP